MVWFERTDAAMARAVRRGLSISIPVTAVATWAFQHSITLPLDEAALATATLVIAVIFVVAVWRDGAFESDPRVVGHTPVVVGMAVASTILVVVRQTMEIGLVFKAAALELRSLNATSVVVAAVVTATAVAWLCTKAGRRLPGMELQRAVKTFAIVFIVQVLIYAVHESAEARLIPGSDAVHSATEPYGPDGVYGLHFSELLVALPLLATVVGVRRPK
ncbi:MAG: hypothetical protein EXQ55_04310 [Acidobacteria bacterium]|nr:hypothetical protein [Acidobacteriota bacterium]